MNFLELKSTVALKMIKIHVQTKSQLFSETRFKIQHTRHILLLGLAYPLRY